MLKASIKGNPNLQLQGLQMHANVFLKAPDMYFRIQMMFIQHVVLACKKKTFFF